MGRNIKLYMLSIDTKTEMATILLSTTSVLGIFSILYDTLLLQTQSYILEKQSF